MNAKTHYTHSELTRRSTEQLIRIYNRLFNDNAWDVWFNPFEHRQDMLLALYEEMVAQDIVARFAAEAQPVARYKALKINITSDGWIVTWGKHHSAPVNNRKFSDQTISLVRSLRSEGESVDFISENFGMPRNRVYRICRGDVYAQ